jgi:lysophospholipase L1-like esterase
MKKTLKILFLILLFGVGSARGLMAQYPYASDIRKFKSADSLSFPPSGEILFIGSSSFRMWNGVESCFPGYPILNRAFGGSTLEDQIRYAADIVYPYHPRQVVIYCGENDFASSDSITPAMVNQRFVTLFTMIRNRLPGVPVTYVSMKPSPSRWRLKDKYIESNHFIRKFLRRQKQTSYVDVWKIMLGKDGQPLPEIFLDDRLHMNAEGYRLWQKAIQPYLIK